jgi:glycerophosphoryl diester phosphodiesterase
VYPRAVEGFAAQGPLLFAHRGAPGEHLENTLPAFRSALALGADVLELDVRMSADGHVFVSHDATGKRVFGVDQAISSSTFGQIKHWRTKGGAGQLYEPATLPEVLEAFPHVALNVDVKQERPDMLTALFDEILGHAAEERVLLTSFSACVLARIRALGYQGPLGMSRVDAALLLLGPRMLPLHRAHRLQIPLHYAKVKLSTRARIERAHAAGLLVDYWVVNDPAEAEHLLDLGADGIVTDDPARISEVFARHVRTRGWRERRREHADSELPARKSTPLSA